MILLNVFFLKTYFKNKSELNASKLVATFLKNMLTPLTVMRFASFSLFLVMAVSTGVRT